MSLFAGRKLARVLIAYEILGDILKASYCRPGERIESDLPADARIVICYTSHEDIATSRNVLTVVVESNAYAEVRPGEPIPLRQVTFRRHVEAAT